MRPGEWMNRRDFISSTTAATSAFALELRRARAMSSFEKSSVDVASGSSAGDISEVWTSRPQLFRGALSHGPGFSFYYGGQPAEVPQKVSQRNLTSSLETTFNYGSGIEAIRTATRITDFDAMVYTVRLRNAGQVRSAVIQKVNALALAFGPKTLKNSYLVSSGGGLYGGTYPPEAFAIKKHYFAPTVPSDCAILLTTAGGRPANRDLPFYFIHSDEESSGIFVGIGWTGQWSSNIEASYTTQELRLLGGIPDMNLELEPGEEITGPRILIGSYDGPLAAGSNKLRSLIQEHYTPKLDGKRFGVIATYDAWWNIAEKYDEALLLPIVDAVASIGQEYFLLDAAWYAGSNGPEGFSGGVGNWNEVDSGKFPSGLAHFANYVRLQNLKFGLWFEPERVRRGSLLAKQHPDWIIWLDDRNHGLLDYGRAEAQQWAREMMDRYITQLGVRYIRHDFNMDPLAYWNSKDTPNRRGLSQIEHIEGFYSVIDWIRERHPATVLECCAGGGRRIDLETAKRFHTFWISDDTVDPEIVRFHLQGINYFLPGNYSYVQYTLPAPTQKIFEPRDFDYLNCFAGAFGVGGRVDLWPAAQKERFILLEQLHKRDPWLPDEGLLPTPAPVDGSWRMGCLAISRPPNKFWLCPGLQTRIGCAVTQGHARWTAN